MYWGKNQNRAHLTWTSNWVLL